MKRFAAIVMVLVLILLQATVVAAAENRIPSPTYDTKIEVEVEGNVKLETVKADEVILNELAMMRDYVDGGQPVYTWMPEDVQEEIKANLNDGVAGEDLVASDVVPMTAEYDENADGTVTSTMNFATPYAVGQQVFAVVGIPKQEKAADGESQMEWVLLKAEVKEEGVVQIVYDQQTLAMMSGKNCMLMLLAEPIAE